MWLQNEYREFPLSFFSTTTTNLGIQWDNFGKEDTLIMLLSAWDRSRDSTAKRNQSNDM